MHGIAQSNFFWIPIQYKNVIKRLLSLKYEILKRHIFINQQMKCQTIVINFDKILAWLYCWSMMHHEMQGEG
jgi:hypothetical protein